MMSETAADKGKENETAFRTCPVQLRCRYGSYDIPAGELLGRIDDQCDPDHWFQPVLSLNTLHSRKMSIKKSPNRDLRAFF